MTMSKQPEVFVCINKRAGGAACMGHGVSIYRALRQRAVERGDVVKVTTSVCMGYCGEGPNVKILGGDFFNGVTPEDFDKILDAAEAKRD